jgi:23S rRNA (adenine2503-C2)-methyltransferase
LNKIEIKNLSLEKIREKLALINEPSYRADQAYDWIYKKGATSFEEMTNLSIRSREKFEKVFSIGKFEAKEFRSKDGTTKFLFTLNDGLAIESVLIPMAERLTLCISSQVGCPLGCKFCLTGKIGFKRNLEPWEMVEQVLHVVRILPKDKKITNIVLMGMGEPLLNFDNVRDAIKTLQRKEGLGFSRNKITLSTVGIVPAIEKMTGQINVKLAVSLNAADDETRSEIMPINKKYPISALMRAVKKHPLKNREMMTFEYVMIRDVNDGPADAEKLAKLVKGMPAKINLIPLNEDPRIEMRRPHFEIVRKFKKYLEDNKVIVTIRESKGQDIKGACGQLAGQ